MYIKLAFGSCLMCNYVRTYVFTNIRTTMYVCMLNVIPNFILWLAHAYVQMYPYMCVCL